MPATEPTITIRPLLEHLRDGLQGLDRARKAAKRGHLEQHLGDLPRAQPSRQRRPGMNPQRHVHHPRRGDRRDRNRLRHRGVQGRAGVQVSVHDTDSQFAQ
ncbi:MAG TPA: hypothetical protein VFB06_00485 [Streptosporangiaceae bacterium]|nr:hypothetical protein [Streptosporangiaceae bacterium]